MPPMSNSNKVIPEQGVSDAPVHQYLFGDIDESLDQRCGLVSVVHPMDEADC